MKLKKYLSETTQDDLAEALGVTQGAISQWLSKGRIPAERVLQIEQATNGAVTRYEMRPDLYPKNQEIT